MTETVPADVWLQHPHCADAAFRDAEGRSHCVHANWDTSKAQVEAELKRRGVKILRGDTKTSFHVEDPDGFEVQLGGLRQ